MKSSSGLVPSISNLRHILIYGTLIQSDILIQIIKLVGNNYQVRVTNKRGKKKVGLKVCLDNNTIAPPYFLGFITCFKIYPLV